MSDDHQEEDHHCHDGDEEEQKARSSGIAITPRELARMLRESEKQRSQEEEAVAAAVAVGSTSVSDASNHRKEDHHHDDEEQQEGRSSGIVITPKELARMLRESEKQRAQEEEGASAGSASCPPVPPAPRNAPAGNAHIVGMSNQLPVGEQEESEEIDDLGVLGIGDVHKMIHQRQPKPQQKHLSVSLPETRAAGASASAAPPPSTSAAVGNHRQQRRRRVPGSSQQSKSRPPHRGRPSLQPGATAVAGIDATPSVVLTLNGDDDLKSGELDLISGFGSSLARAMPVPSREINLEVHGTADCVDPLAVLQQQERQRRREQQQVLAIVGLLLLVIAGIALGSVWWAIKSSDNNDTATSAAATIIIPTSEPSEPPTKMPTPPLFTLPLFPLEHVTFLALQVPTSPQFKAYQWMLNDPNLHHCPTWRRQQQIALATLCYATNTKGGDWKDATHWLSYEVSECDWAFRGGYGLDELDQRGELASRGVEVMRQAYSDPTLMASWGAFTKGLGTEIQACNEKGVLNHLWLCNNNLAGTIPAELFLMLSDSLITSELSTNKDLKESIPTLIGMLSNLKFLILEENSLTGRLPSEFGQLESLKLLSIEEQSFSGEIPTEMGLLDLLLHLALEDNGLTSTLPVELMDLANIAVMRIGENLVSTIPPEIRNLNRTLQVLDLWENLQGSMPSKRMDAFVNVA